MRGAIYAAVGKSPKFLEWAAYSAGLLRVLTPDVRIGVLTDRPGAKQLSSFDDVLETDSVERVDWHGIKIAAMLKSSYDPCLFLDCDTVVCEDLTPVFDLVDSEWIDVAVTHRRNQRSRFPQRVPGGFPYFSSGVIAFERNDKVLAFLGDWQKRFDHYKVAHAEHRKDANAPHPDQASFREALYYSNLRVAVLPKEYNCTFWTGAVQGRVKILHVHGAGGRKLWRMAKRLNANAGEPRLFRNREII